LSVRRQCQLLGLSRSTWHYRSVEESADNLRLMRQIDEQYLRTPFYGSRRMAIWLAREGHEVNRKRVQRLMRLMGIEAIYPKPRTTGRNPQHRVFPYLLRNVKIMRPDQVWSTDITYVPMPRGFMYLTAVIDWYSRYVLSWRLSNSLEGIFCLEALDDALQNGRPEIFNTDQGVQYTTTAFTGRLEQAGVAISMDGRGRALDNVFVERLWRSVKYESLYLHGFSTVPELECGLNDYFDFYCHRRPHQSLDYRTPAEVYGRRTKKPIKLRRSNP
jgi:putative transposase